MVAGEEELDRLELLEEFFEAAIIEILSWTDGAARRQRHGLGADDAVGIERRGIHFLLGVKEGQQRGAGAEHPKQLFYGLFEQGGSEELQGVPQERAIEAPIGEGQGLLEKSRGAPGIGLVSAIVALHGEGLLHGVHEVIGVDAMTEGGDEADISLAGTGEIEDGEVLLVRNAGEELFQAVAGSGLRRRHPRVFS